LPKIANRFKLIIQMMLLQLRKVDFCLIYSIKGDDGGGAEEPLPQPSPVYRGGSKPTLAIGKIGKLCTPFGRNFNGKRCAEFCQRMSC
jgi:hypothetical protein